MRNNEVLPTWGNPMMPVFIEAAFSRQLSVGGEDHAAAGMKITTYQNK